MLGRSSLALLGALAIFCAAPAHAEKRENAVEFFVQEYARGTSFQPLGAVAPVVRRTERMLTRSIDGVVRHAQRGFASGAAGASDVVASAARFIGTNPTGWAHNWCAEFANRILDQEGYATSGSPAAMSFASYGPRLRGPVPGAIAVLPHHVGFVESVTPAGDVVLVSGNGGRRPGVVGRVTARSLYARRAFVAFVMPRRIRFASN